MIAQKFTQIFTMLMSQILADMKKGLEEKVIVQVLFFLCLDGKGKMKRIMFFIKCLKDCKCKRLQNIFLSFQRHIKTALLQKRARNPSENLWVPPNIWIKLPELASQKNHIKYQSQSTCIKTHKNLSVSHSPIFLSTGFWLFDCCLIRLFLIVHIT